MVAQYFQEQAKTNDNKGLPKVNMEGKLIPNRPWIIDSGATEHITCEKGGASVTVPNGESISVEGAGNTVLANKLQINNVLNIPVFKCNLLLVSRLTKDLHSVLTFYPDFCVMQDLRSRKLIGVGIERNGLYCLEPMQNLKMAMKTSTNSEIWHRRLGHASKVKLHNICSFDKFCDSCIRAKQTRSPFPTSSIQTVDCFELIHCDIRGGYKTASFKGAYYFFYHC